MSVVIKKVSTKSDLKKFIRFNYEFYKDNPYSVPDLYSDMVDTLSRDKNAAFEFCEADYFLAYRDGKIVGRVAAIINHRANETWQKKTVRFGWIDFVDDAEVSDALIDTVKAWGRERGMQEIEGPLGFTDMDSEGMLIEGFEELSTMATIYNYPYYVDHFDRYGLVKEADWIEFLVSTPHQIPEKMERVAKIVMEKYKIRIDKVRTVKELKEKYGYTYFDVIDAAYQPLYNFQPLTQRQKEYYAEMYFPLINFDFITIAINEHDEIVGVGIGMPDISKALQETRGKLFPFGWIKLLKALKAKQMDTFNLLLIAVRPDYQNKGVNALFFYDQIPYFQKYGIKYTETTAILEENSKNQANFAYFETKQHKRRRAYIKQL